MIVQETLQTTETETTQTTETETTQIMEIETIRLIDHSITQTEDQFIIIIRTDPVITLEKEATINRTDQELILNHRIAIILNFQTHKNKIKYHLQMEQNQTLQILTIQKPQNYYRTTYIVEPQMTKIIRKTYSLLISSK